MLGVWVILGLGIRAEGLGRIQGQRVEAVWVQEIGVVPKGSQFQV